MTVYVPSATVRIERGEAVDSYGDPVDLAQVYATGLPVAITERRQRSFQPSEQRGGQIEEFTIRLRPGSPVQEGDRLIDERTGEKYQVRDVHHAPSLVGAADVRVTAVQVGAVSIP